MQQSPGDVPPAQQRPEEVRAVPFVSFVLDTAQATWAQLLPERMRTPWHDAKFALLRIATQTGCGVGETAMGPFYCPLDQRIYIDLACYDEL